VDSLNTTKWPKLVVVTGLDIHYLIGNQFQDPFPQKIPLEGYYGLTWNKDGLFLGGRFAVTIISKNSDVIQHLAFTRERNGLHQILFYEDYLYAVATGTNFLDKIDPHTKQVQSVDLHPEKTNNKDDSSDWSHINSVFAKDGKLYVVHHNFHQPSYITVLDLDLNILKQINDVGQQNHNVYVDDNTLYTLSSLTSEVVKLNLKTKKKEVVKIGGTIEGLEDDITYLRGFAKSKDHFVFGITHSHGRDERDTVQSYLLLYDNDLNFVDKMIIPKTGQVREVRLIEETDYAHNQMRFPL